MTDCQIYQGSQNTSGHCPVSMYSGGRRYTVNAHRLAWALHNGRDPKGFVVRHSCDVPNCVNPAHLELGTSADNANDRKLRNRGHRPVGQLNGRSKLSQEDAWLIREMLTDGVKRRDVAESFLVHVSCISKIASGVTWK